MENVEKVKKVTKRDNFKALLEIEEVKANQGLVDFINHELELLDNQQVEQQQQQQIKKQTKKLKKLLLANL